MVELNLSDKITVLRVLNIHDEVHNTSVIGKLLSKIDITSTVRFLPSPNSKNNIRVSTFQTNKNKRSLN